MPSPIYGGGGISNPNSSNVTFSDPTKTLLLGDTAIYSDIASTLPGAQLLVQVHDSDPNSALGVVGNYRNGVSGARYYSRFSNDCHFETNTYMSIIGSSHNGLPASMLSIDQDVAIGMVLVSTAFSDASGGKFIKGYGATDGGANLVEAWDIGSQGTLTLLNPYGQTGAVQYTKPQFILGDIGTNYASPSWTYSSIRQAAGHLRIGSYSSSTEGDEIDVVAGAVKVNGTLEVTGHDKLEGVTSTGATGTGKHVYDTSATLVTPLLGTPTSGTLTNCTGLPGAGILAGVPRIVQTITTTDGQANITFTVPGGYTHAVIKFIGKVRNNSGIQLYMQFNGDTGNNYDSDEEYIFGSGTVGVNNYHNTSQLVITDMTDSTYTTSSVIDIPFYSNTTFVKHFNARSVNDVTTNSRADQFLGAGQWANTAAITSITLTESNSLFPANCVATLTMQ